MAAGKEGILLIPQQDSTDRHNKKSDKNRQLDSLKITSPALTPTDKKIDVSIVIPLLNKAGNLDLLSFQLRQFLNIWQRSCEINFVDAGSTDNPFKTLK